MTEFNSDIQQATDKQLRSLQNEVDFMQRQISSLQNFKSNATIAIMLALALVVMAWVWLVGTIL